MAWHRIWPLGLVVGFVMGLGLWTPTRRTLFLSGAYRYPEAARPLPGSTIEPGFVSWLDPDAASRIEAQLQAARQRRSLALVTLEPFEDPAMARDGRGLVRDVELGRYDNRLLPLLQRLCNPQQPVLLRFAHEMDLVGQYPWSFRDGRHYVRLYRAVWSRAQMPRCRRLHWVWSPAAGGDPRPFWPGADAVDLIGISLFTSRRWSPSGALSSFAELYGRRRWLQRQLGKPVLVAEMGVGAEPAAQRRWLLDARQAIRRYPELVGWVYFSAPQPRWLPLPTGHEDWSLSAAVLALVTAPLPRPSVP